MKQDANTPNNDILNRLRENVENRTTNTDVATSKAQEASMTPEQLLDQLKKQMGDQVAVNDEGSMPEDDYDIRGFEIEQVVEDETLEAEEENEAVTEETELIVSDALKKTDAEDEDAVPWETAEVPTSSFSDESVLTVQDTPEVADAKLVDRNEAREATETESCDSDEISEDEFDESLSEDALPMEQEALRKQIERFVEKTVEPDDVLDYFEGLDKKAAKQRENAGQSSMPTNEDACPAITNEEAQPVELADISTVVEEDIVAENAKEEYEPQTLESEIPAALNPAVDRFFFKNTENASQEIDAREAVNASTQAMDDTDINLLLALGKKQELEDTVGFVRVREAKNNFYDPTDEESLGNHVFAYDGEEFHDPIQVSSIKNRYRKEKKVLLRRLLGSLFIALLLLFAEHLPMTSFNIPGVSAFLAKDITAQLINLLLILSGMLLSLKQLFDGAKGFFVLRPNRYTPLSMMAFSNVAYDVIVLLFFRESGAMFYNFAVAVSLVISIVGDAIRLTKEMMTFDIISDPREKFSLEKADRTPEISREEKILLKRDLLVEKVSFVGKYFTRTARRSTAYTEYFVELLATLIAASFAAIGIAILQKDLLSAMNTFMLVFVACMPMQHLIGSYPFGRLSKLLYRHDSAIIGEAVDREYVGANTVYLDDVEVFGHHGVSISGLRTYNDADFYDVLYYALAAFSRVEGPLRYVFESSSPKIEKAEDVNLLRIDVNGIEALVDGVSTVLIGNVEFMRANRLVPKQNEEDDRRVENGEICILYMAINGALCAKFYMKYTITKRFEAFVSEMHENNTQVGVRTLDPNVNEKMLSLLRKDKETTISVIRPTLNDLVPMGRRSDSSIITAKNSHMIARILALCGRVKKVNRTCAILRVCSMLAAFLAVVTLVFAQRIAWIPSVAIVIYQLLWIIPFTVYTATKLK